MKTIPTRPKALFRRGLHGFNYSFDGGGIRVEVEYAEETVSFSGAYFSFNLRYASLRFVLVCAQRAPLCALLS